MKDFSRIVSHSEDEFLKRGCVTRYELADFAGVTRQLVDVAMTRQKTVLRLVYDSHSKSDGPDADKITIASALQFLKRRVLRLKKEKQLLTDFIRFHGLQSEFRSWRYYSDEQRKEAIAGADRKREEERIHREKMKNWKSSKIRL